MKLKSVIGWSLAVALVLLLVMAAAIKLFYGPDKIVATLLPQLENSFQRQIEYGDVEFTVFNGIGVRLHNVRVKNDPGFDREHFLSIDQLDCTVRLMPLLRGQVEFARLIMHQPELYLIRNLEGRRNYHVADTTIGVAGDEQALETLLDFDEFVIRQGRLIWRHDSAEVKVVVGQLDYRGRLHGREQRVLEGRLEADSLLLATAIEDLLIHPAEFEADFSFRYHPDGDSLQVSYCNVFVGDLKARLTGKILDFSSSPDVDLSLIAPRVRLDRLQNSALLTPLTFLRDVELSGDLRLDATYRGLLNDPRADNLRGKVTLTDFEAKARKLRTEFETKLAELNFNSQSISFYTEEASVGGAPAACRLALDNFGDPNFSAELRFTAEAELVGKLLQWESADDLEGRVEVNLSGFARLREQEDLRLLGSIVVDDLSGELPFWSEPIDNLELNCQLLGRDVQVQRLSVASGDSDFRLTGKLAGFAPYLASGGDPKMRPFCEFELTGDNLDFDLFAAGSPDSDSTASLLDQLPDIDAEGTLYCSRAAFAGVQLEELAGCLTLLSQVLHLDSLTARVYGGRAAGEAIIEFDNEGRPDWELEIDAEGFEINSLLRRFTGFEDHLSGSTRMLAEFRGRGSSEAEIVSSLRAAGSLTMARGRLTHFPARDRLENYLGFDPVSQESISDLTASFAIDNSQLNLSDLTFSGGGRYHLQGVIAFDSDLQLNVSLPITPDQARLLDINAEARRQIRSLGYGSVELGIAGPADNPDIEILSATAARDR
jgi:uncharacterized protein involved in outer membrane biogenesis